MFPDNTCRFLVFDFDNHVKSAEKNDYADDNEIWKEEVLALYTICKENNIDALIEKSRSGRGAHVWIFFKKPIKAALARKFGDTLLNKGASFVNLTSFDYYDRMIPAQDFLKKEGLGNLIALPLQGDVVNDGRSVFVDENWEPYENQFDKRLRAYKKIGFMFNDDSKNNLQSDYSCNAIYDYETYGPVYQLDVCEAKSEVIISSPILSQEKIGWLIEIASKKQVNGAKFKIVTMDPDEYKYGDSLKWKLLHEEIKASGIEIILSQNEDKKFTVIDNNIVWYGSLNFLGKSSVEDNLMRVINKSIAEEVIGLACK